MTRRIRLISGILDKSEPMALRHPFVTQRKPLRFLLLLDASQDLLRVTVPARIHEIA